ncbi:MAG: hypothetical protein EHM28_08610 [Spirochaetaceae bacterium]|nr:MAG: hypothetical protein EHM28_08610 [Spirochaetaceae bacterium]
MDETTNNPVEELKQLNRAIHQYEIVLKTTKDPVQKHRVSKELVRLRDYREKFHHVYSVVEEETEQTSENEFEGFPFLYQNVSLDEDRLAHDREVNALLAILHFFEKEFLSLMTERRLKLDFKYSLERDGFYHLFQDIQKRISDFEDELKIINNGNYKEAALTEIKNRRLRKRRILIIETDKFFRRLKKFDQEILEDIEKDGTACLNKDERVHFEMIEGMRYLEGYTVAESMSIMFQFTNEAISYFNLPEIIVQE